jgi:hypothetical protein
MSKTAISILCFSAIQFFTIDKVKLFDLLTAAFCIFPVVASSLRMQTGIFSAPLLSP